VLDDATLDAWAASDDPVRRQHAANFRALREGKTVGPPASSPSLATRAGYLAKAVVAAVATGGETVSPEERARRLAICASCEHFDDAARRCRVCTCHMPLKVRLAAWHCPLPEPKW
jgi:hypothetical protein